ncbi:MAG: hypothetical protein ACQESD_06475, partial [Thermoplasmatota archaeon]
EKESKESKKKKYIVKKVKKWEKKGWDVSTLKEKIRAGDKKPIKLLKEYRKKMNKLRNLKSKYDALPTYKIEADIIDADFKNPDMLDFLEERVEKIEELLDKKRDMKWETMEKDLEAKTERLEKKMNPPQQDFDVEPVEVEPAQGRDQTTFDNSQQTVTQSTTSPQKTKPSAPKNPSTQEEWITALKKPENNWHIFGRDFDVDTEEKFIGYLIENEELRRAFQTFSIYWNRKRDNKYFRRREEKEGAADEDIRIFSIEKPHFVALLYCLANMIEDGKVGISKGPNINYFKEYIKNYNGNIQVINEKKEAEVKDKGEYIKYEVKG